jgi:hypothetical protein
MAKQIEKTYSPDFRMVTIQDCLSRQSSYDRWQDLLATPPPEIEFPSRCSSLEFARSSSCENELQPVIPAGIIDENDFNYCIQPCQTGNFQLTDFKYFVEGEDRRVTISNIAPDTTSDELYRTIEQYGDFNILEADVRAGIATVRFYDLRSAQWIRAVRICLHGKYWMVRFAPVDCSFDRRNPPNNGTIVLFNLRTGISDEEITTEFARFGDIRDVRRGRAKDTQRFVEFWDLRAAESAVKECRGKIILNSKISVEFSLPGGFRRFPDEHRDIPVPTIERPRDRESSKIQFM